MRGSCWDEANAHAESFVREHSAVEKGSAVLIHPFDHPEIWQGHATLVHELKYQLPEPPSCVVLSVGGGGLLVGVLQVRNHFDFIVPTLLQSSS